MPQRAAQALRDEPRPRFYTVSETAAMLRMSAITIYRAINDGEFPAVRVRGRLTIPAKVIDALVDTAKRSHSLVDPADWVRRASPPPDVATESRPRPGANQTGAGSFSTQHVAGYGEGVTPADRAARRGGVL
jgi:excisionase family DNA binding protein